MIGRRRRAAVIGIAGAAAAGAAAAAAADRWTADGRAHRKAVVRHGGGTAVSRIGPGTVTPRDALGRRPPRRLAALGARPPRTGESGPGRRPAPHRRQRRAPGLRRDDAVAAPPRPRTERRQQRRCRAAGHRPGLAACDMATPVAPGAAHGGPARRDGREVRTASSRSFARRPICRPTSRRAASVAISRPGFSRSKVRTRSTATRPMSMSWQTPGTG